MSADRRPVEVLLVAGDGDGDDIAEMLAEASTPSTHPARINSGQAPDEDPDAGGDLDVTRVVDPGSALSRIDAEPPDVVLVDLDAYDDADSVLLAPLFDREHPSPVVVLTGLADRTTAIEAVRQGAEEYLVKEEATPELLVRSVSHAVERAATERELSRFEALVKESTDAIAVVDAEGTVEYITPSVEHVVGYRPAAIVGENAFEYVHPDDRERAAAEFQAMVEDPDYNAAAEFRFQHEDGHWVTIHARGRNLVDDPAVGGLVVYTHDITQRREYEQRLSTREACLRRTAEILADRDRGFDAQIDAVLEVGREMLDVEYGTLSRISEDTYVFEAVSGVDDAVQPGDTVPLSSTNCERTVTREQCLVLEDIAEEAPDLAARDGNRDLGVNCYLGTPVVVDGTVVGTFCFYGSGTGEGFSEWAETYVDLVAEWIGSELERSQQTDRLTVLNQLHGIVHDVTEAVISRSTREEIEATACRRLADSTSYEFAWVAERDAPSQETTPRTAAGIDDADLPAVQSPVPSDDPDGLDPTVRALKTGETRLVRDVFTDPRQEPWREAADRFGFRSMAAIPIRHEDTVYAVLNVYTDRENAFDDAERTVVGHLGEIIGHAIAAAQRKQALVSDAVVELELELPDAFADVDGVADLEASVRVDRLLSVSDADYLLYGTTAASAIEGVEAAARAVDAWDDLSVVGDTPDGVAFQLRLSEPPVLSTVASLGGAVERAVVEDGDYRLTAQFPTGTDVRGVVDELEDEYPRVDVVARRQVTRAGDPQRFARAWRERLTDRQRTVLEAAFHAGFFEWPRETSGQEVADSLGVTPPTFHQHLRTAERKLLGTLLEGQLAPADADGSQ